MNAIPKPVGIKEPCLVCMPLKLIYQSITQLSQVLQLLCIFNGSQKIINYLYYRWPFISDFIFKGMSFFPWQNWFWFCVFDCALFFESGRFFYVCVVSFIPFLLFYSLSPILFPFFPFKLNYLSGSWCFLFLQLRCLLAQLFFELNSKHDSKKIDSNLNVEFLLF